MDTIARTGVPPITALTVITLVIIFLIHEITGEFKAEKHTVRPEHGFEPSKWYRFFTSPLVHSNLLYLVLSVVGLLVIGTRLERKLGSMLYLYTQLIGYLGTVLLFCMMGALLYFLSAYDKWMEAKHTGFGPVLFCLAVVESYVGKRDMFRILLPWVLVPLLPMILHRVSVLSVFSGALFGFLLTRGHLGRILLPSRDGVVRAENSWVGRSLANTWRNFAPVWSDTATAPFEQAAEGSMCSDLHPNVGTYESIRLIPMSSKEATAQSGAQPV
jgi:membrane associated rhomboid family serine protease